jgi:hypothetical protein
MKYCFKSLKNLFLVFALVVSAYALASDMFVVEIKLENHQFIPDVVRVPEGVKIKLVVDNLDSSIEEFDSPALKREKILRSNTKTNIILAPLRKGRYDFVGEFHADTAKGTLIVE